MSARLEGIAQRIQGVADMKKITKAMGATVKGMDQASTRWRGRGGWCCGTLTCSLERQ